MRKSKPRATTTPTTPDPATEWRSYLPKEEQSGDEIRKDNLENRRASWDSLIVPADGEFIQWLILRLAVPQVWVTSGLWAVKTLAGWSLIIAAIWLLPVVVYTFICWQQRSLSGSWLYVQLGIVAFSLVLALPGIVGVFGG